MFFATVSPHLERDVLGYVPGISRYDTESRQGLSPDLITNNPGRDAPDTVARLQCGPNGCRAGIPIFNFFDFHLK